MASWSQRISTDDVMANPDESCVHRGFSFSAITMLKAAPKPCTHPGCGVLVRDGSSRCTRHPQAAWVRKPTATKRITGRRLQAMRAALFSANPLCVECRRLGRVTLATQRDHIKPLAEGGLDDSDNEQGLCEECHDVKSKVEAMRGRHRQG